MTTYGAENRPPILVVGGDQREAELVVRWRRRGGKAQSFGHDAGQVGLPPPTQLRGVLVVAPPSGIDSAGRVRGAAGTLVLRPGHLAASLGVMAGAVAPDWAQQLAVPWAAYRDRPTFAWPNAIPTAEGALAWALASGTTTVEGSRFLVAGLGRVGTTLAVRARALGARVVVVDRDASARGRARALGLEAVPFGPGTLAGADWLFNTVPVPVFSREDVLSLPPTALVLDLASLPGGFAEGVAETLGTRLAVDRTVPGRVAPVAAAAVLERCVVELWQEWCEGHGSPLLGRPREGDVR